MPADVYFGRAETLLQARHAAMLAAYARHPERFPSGLPKRPQLPAATYINPPQENTATPTTEKPKESILIY